jgi:hypothetical protein
MGRILDNERLVDEGPERRMDLMPTWLTDNKGKWNQTQLLVVLNGATGGARKKRVNKGQ